MASTYTPIATTTGTGSSGTVSFTSIPSTYTDLIIVATGTGSASTTSFEMRFNNDTGSNYSRTYMLGNGTGASSGRDPNGVSINLGVAEANNNAIIHIMNYSNTTTYKTAIERINAISSFTAAVVGLWRNTAAINRIDLFLGTGTWNTTATFTLYGIKAA